MLWRSRVSAAAEDGLAGDSVAAVIDGAVAMLADDVAGLRLVGLDGPDHGYAPEAYRVSAAIAKTGDAQTALFLAIRTWLLVDDLDRARRTAEALGRMSDGTAEDRTLLSPRDCRALGRFHDVGAVRRRDAHAKAPTASRKRPSGSLSRSVIPRRRCGWIGATPCPRARSVDWAPA